MSAAGSAQDAAAEIDGAAAAVAVVGAGPAGLAAAEAASEVAAAAGRRLGILVLEARPSPARKLLMAGKSGLNITHVETFERFKSRYRDISPALMAAIEAPLAGEASLAGEAFAPEAIRSWMAGLGQESVVGSSGRVFPAAMKASPLLRAWLARLAARGVTLRTRWRWTGWAPDGRLRFETPEGPQAIAAAATVLALGGASWPRLGSDGAWAATLAAAGAPLAPFRPSNVGWAAPFGAAFRERFQGAPLKNLVLTAGGERAAGELMITAYGLEGGPIYALTPALLAGAPLTADLAPGRAEAALAAALAKPRGKASLANWLRKAARLDPAKIGLLRESGALPADPAGLAARIKACPIALSGPRPIEEAISTAGGLAWEGLTADLELRARPGVFAAGEMIAWDAPTGGYLLSACLALGRKAGAAAARRALAGEGGRLA